MLESLDSHFRRKRYIERRLLALHPVRFWVVWRYGCGNWRFQVTVVWGGAFISGAFQRVGLFFSGDTFASFASTAVVRNSRAEKWVCRCA